MSLRQPRRKHAGGAATGNLDLAAGALAASHSKDDRTPGELQHTGTAHERDGMDCGGSRRLVRIQRVHSRALARINPKHHAAQEQHDVGRAYLVDKALRVLGTGKFLLKVRQAKTRVNALAEDSAQMLLAFHDGYTRSSLLRGKRGRHAGGAASDNDHVEGLRCHGLNGIVINRARFEFRHLSAPPSAVPQPAKIRHPPTAPRWGRSSARAPGSQSRGFGKNRSGTDPCRHDSGA